MTVRRLVQVVTALAVATGSVALGTAAPAQARPSYGVSTMGTFSPDGDGLRDTLRVRYTVPKPTKVTLEVALAGRHKGRVVRTVELGWRGKGSYAWTWDGRNDQGNRVADSLYSIVLRLPGGSTVASDRTKVDTWFKPELTTPAYGLAEPRARVFPRSTEVSDTVPLTARTDELRIRSLRVVVRNASGKVVRDAEADEPLRNDTGHLYGYGATVPWAAQRGGKPLPPGRYTAVATGRDKAGNLGHSDPLRIWVSADKLVWKDVSTTVAAGEARTFGICTYTPSPGCGDYQPCGHVVASTLFPAGLSYRSQPCADPASFFSQATRWNLIEYPEATGVRGLGAVRIAFTGAPTTAGEADTGTLSVWDTEADAEVVGTSGQSAWAEHPSWGEGLVGDPDEDVPDRAPAAAWTFTTKGTDSVDVAGFTVDVRYLVIAD